MNLRHLFTFSSLFILVLACQKRKIEQGSYPLVSIVAADSNTYCMNSIQLSDGEMVLFGTSLRAFSSQYYYFHTSKLKTNGDLCWTKSITAIKGVPVNSGRFIVSDAYNIGLYDQDGNLVQQKKLPTTNLHNLKLDMINLSNNRLAIAREVYSEQGNATVDLSIFDEELNLVKDSMLFSSGFNWNCRAIHDFKLLEGQGNALFIIGTKDTLAGCPFLMKVSTNTLSIDAYRVYTEYGKAKPDFIAMNQQGAPLIGFTRGYNQYTMYYGLKTFRSDTSIVVLQTDLSGNPIQTYVYSGYPKLGFISRMIQTSDGGFLMAGTCNQETDFSIKSFTKVLLLKVDANMQQQWMRMINTTFPSWGIDVCRDRLSGNYLVSGFQQSFDNIFKMMLLRTDQNGNL